MAEDTPIPTVTPATPPAPPATPPAPTVAVVPPLPVPTPSAGPNNDISSLATLIAAIPEQVARAVRESTPSAPSTPVATEPPKAAENPAPASATPVAGETQPGKQEHKTTFFGMPWS